jgi:hypothetical protein
MRKTTALLLYHPRMYAHSAPQHQQLLPMGLMHYGRSASASKASAIALATPAGALFVDRAARAMLH